MDQQSLSKLARFKAWHARTWSAGWIGKAKIIVLWYMVIMLCAAILLGEKRMPTDGTLVSSDTEVVTRQVLTTSNGARAIAQRTLHDVYDLAQQKPQLQSVSRLGEKSMVSSRRCKAPSHPWISPIQ